MKSFSVIARQEACLPEKNFAEGVAALITDPEGDFVIGGLQPGGLTKRLHLYLEYPDLRTEFTEIERSVPAPVQRAVKRCASLKKDRGGTWPRFLLLPGFEKRCCR